MLIFLSYLTSFILPVCVFFFLKSGPHDAAMALLWTLPLWAMVIADWLSPTVKHQYPVKTSSGLFDLILYGLSLLQFLNIAMMLEYASQLQWQTPAEIITAIVNLIVIRILVGTSSGSSAFIVAHELIHRSNKLQQKLGQWLLYTVCYEHFKIAHLYGHHPSVGKPDDIATAKRGESFADYWKRVYIAHFRYAWNFELDRLGVKQKPFRLINLFRNRAFQGVLVESALLLLILLMYGWIAVFIFLYQALAAVRLLETINYYQHWGLTDAKTANALAWTNDSWLTKYALIGLSNHIGHHNNAKKHFQNIPYSDQGPKMPQGYFVMNLWVKLFNASYQQMAIKELKRYGANQILIADKQI